METAGAPASPPPPTPPPDWRVGDPIDKRDAQGRYPDWDTVRSCYWQNRAQSAAADEFSAQNLGRMKTGYAPVARMIARLRATGEEVELVGAKELQHIAG